MSDFTTFASIFNAGASTYRNENVGNILMKDATLADLTYTLSQYFTDSLTTTEKTIPPQAKYAELVNTGLTQLNFFNFVAQSLFRVISYGDYEFGKFTVFSRVESFSKITKEEYLANKDYYLNRFVLEQQLKEVQPLEIIRAVRLALQQLIFRFFRTYDVNEKREFGKKSVKVCDPTSATFRRDDRQITTEEFRYFVEDLISACGLINKFTPELTEFRDVFVTAAKTAKQMRAEFQKEHSTTSTSQPQTEQDGSSKKVYRNKNAQTNQNRDVSRGDSRGDSRGGSRFRKN
jgi:hypothetical protein